MQKRTEAAYSELLTFLKQLMPRWQPERIVCDNEKALVNAWIAAFPNARIVACLWHYGTVRAPFL